MSFWRLDFGATWRVTHNDTLLFNGHAALQLETFSGAALELEPGEWRFLPDGAVRELSATRELSAVLGEAKLQLRESWREVGSALERRVYARLQSGESLRVRFATLELSGFAASPNATVSVPMARDFARVPMQTALRRRGSGLPTTLRHAREHNAGFDFADVSTTLDFCVSAPDIFPGTALLDNGETRLTIAPLTPGCSARLSVHGEAQLAIAHRFECDAVPGRDWVELGGQRWQATRDSESDALREVANAFARGELTLLPMAPPTNRPAWAKGARVLEVDLAHVGGLKAARARLKAWRDLGFNTIYLMPWHSGGYGTRDYLEVNPDYGTFADLRAFCDSAHELGMRVLFDLLVNIAGEGSLLPSQHPDWFYRDASGQPMPHPTWGGTCLDSLSPGFRAYLKDYVARCCSQDRDGLGADGFRVDAVAYRGNPPVWNATGAAMQPRAHAEAVFSLVGELRDAIRAVNSDAILLAECFGPSQVPLSDLVGFQWIDWLDWALEGLDNGQLSGQKLSAHLQQHFAILPPGTWLVGYTHTHDSKAFTGRDLQSANIDAFFATLSLLCAASMTFTGGWEMRARPDENERAWFRALHEFGGHLGGVAASDVTFLPSPASNLLLAQRPSARGDVLVATNFGREAIAWGDEINVNGERLFSRLGSQAGEIAPGDTVVVTSA